MKKIYLMIFMALCSLSFVGCAMSQPIAAQAASSLNKRALAENLIQQDWNLFMNFKRQGFSDRLSMGFLPDKQAFLNEVEASFYESVPIALSFTIDKALMKNDKLAVTITWQRKRANRNSGDLILKKGECTIVYVNENDQWLIYKIIGDSLFTF